MSDLTVAFTFSKNNGDPATGEALADFDLWLTEQDRATGADAVVWDGTQNPTEEIDNVGSYIRIYANADLDANNYFARGDYTGATSMDVDTVTGAVSLNNIPIGTAIEFTYTVTNSVSGNPIDGATVRVSTDIAGNNMVWAGETDAFGIARDDNSLLPRLDPGTYYFWTTLSGFVFVNPDAEAISALSTSGSTVGTPISAGTGTGLKMATPLTRTILSLPRYAMIMGLNPAHFAGGFGETVFPVDGCDDVWPRHSWQANDRVSHEELANTIYVVEEDIANILGYYPAPKWVAKEMHPYPRHNRREAYSFGLNSRGLYESITTKKSRFIQAGQRAVSLIGTATTTGGSLSYTDEDSDGQVDTATITLTTTLTDACEINAYFTGESGDPQWEIRPARSKSISGGILTMVFDSWLFIDPDLLSAFPTTSGFSGVDITTTGNYVTSVDVYREYTDSTQESAEFSWEPKPDNLLMTTFCTTCGGTGCAACQNITQTGCVHIRDVDSGIIVPTPATYSASDAQWSEDQWTECRAPDTVKIWYYAGDLSERFLRGSDCDRLSIQFAQGIAWAATARLERPPCGCNNIRSMFAALRRDIAFIGSGEGEGSYQVSPDDLDNPLGTRLGEVQAWRRIRKLTERTPDFALV